jgi:hypothetical protein
MTAGDVYEGPENILDVCSVSMDVRGTVVVHI